MNPEWIGKYVRVVCANWTYWGTLIETSELTIIIQEPYGKTTIHQGVIESISVRADEKELT